jgi:hypothetical protein
MAYIEFIRLNCLHSTILLKEEMTVRSFFYALMLLIPVLSADQDIEKLAELCAAGDQRMCRHR